VPEISIAVAVGRKHELDPQLRCSHIDRCVEPHDSRNGANGVPVNLQARADYRHIDKNIRFGGWHRSRMRLSSLHKLHEPRVAEAVASRLAECRSQTSNMVGMHVRDHDAIQLLEVHIQ
jgi:hypothetical protein